MENKVVDNIGDYVDSIATEAEALGKLVEATADEGLSLGQKVGIGALKALSFGFTVAHYQQHHGLPAAVGLR